MAFARLLRLALLANGATHAACQTRNLRNGTLSSFAQQEDASCVRDAHCQMTGDSQCKCTYNGGSTFEDPCKCGVCSVDPHCQMSGSVCSPKRGRGGTQTLGTRTTMYVPREVAVASLPHCSSVVTEAMLEESTLADLIEIAKPWGMKRRVVGFGYKRMRCHLNVFFGLDITCMYCLLFV